MTAYEQLTIDTPEQIALEFKLAGVGSRFLALLIDSFFQLMAFVVLGMATMGLLFIIPTRFENAFAIWIVAAALLVAFSVWYGYFAAFEILWRGQTPGKRALGLRAIAASGRPMSATQAILRNLLRIVDQLPGLYAVGILSILLTARNQRLGDLAAGTVVVREQPVQGAEQFAAADAAGVSRARGDQLRASRLSDQELALIERFLERRNDLEWELRDRTSQQIASRIRQRLGITADGRDEELLERVMAEYRGSSSSHQG